MISIDHKDKITKNSRIYSFSPLWLTRFLTRINGNPCSSWPIQRWVQWVNLPATPLNFATLVCAHSIRVFVLLGNLKLVHSHIKTYNSRQPAFKPHDPIPFLKWNYLFLISGEHKTLKTCTWFQSTCPTTSNLTSLWAYAS